MKRMLSLLLVCCLLACPALAYTASDWAREETAAAADLLPSSMTDADLTAPISRGDFTFLAMALYQNLTGDKTPRTPQTPFSDVTAGGLLTAQALGIVNGFPDGTFRSGDFLTRQQAAVILARTAVLVKRSAAGTAVTFSDAAAIAPWAKDAVAALSAAGVVKGTENGKFSPLASVTGQEALVMVGRIKALPAASASDSFAAGLFAGVKGEKNPVLSPVSAKLCLALVRAGAGGDTKAQMDAALGSTDLSALNAALKTVSGGPTVEVANSLWFDTSVTPNAAYLNTLKTDYGAQSQTLDLTGSSALPTINGWVREKTHGLIATILDQPLSGDAAAVLLNALYFKADWATPFVTDDTYAQSFTTAAGQTVQTPFLHATRHGMKLLSSKTCTGVALPYQGNGDWWMLALRPAQGTDASALTGSDFATLLSGASDSYVALSLPKFTLTGTYDLTKALQGLGITDAFDASKADFSAMGSCSKGTLALSQVLQKTYLRVDEKGTEAAAVTGAMMSATSVPTEEPVVMTFDSPFLCCVWNASVHQALFLGVVEDPR